jgi:hypothetical protein
MTDTANSQNAFSGSGNWTREQLKLAFYFYCQTPFGKLHGRNPAIIELAKLIGRTPSALAMKLVNFASLDPSIINTGRRGLTGASALDREIWDEFHASWERLAVECELLRQGQLRRHGLEEGLIDGEERELTPLDFVGETRQAIVQLRVKQKFFRRAVLASYRSRCCISGVTDERLLIASHIVPWREDKTNRLNPSNGLCLSAIHDRAFDRGLFTLSDNLSVALSKHLRNTKDEFLKQVFLPIEGKRIELPDRFAPDPDFLQHHRKTLFIGA